MFGDHPTREKALAALILNDAASRGTLDAWWRGRRVSPGVLARIERIARELGIKRPARRPSSAPPAPGPEPGQ